VQRRELATCDDEDRPVRPAQRAGCVADRARSRVQGGDERARLGPGYEAWCVLRRAELGTPRWQRANLASRCTTVSGVQVTTSWSRWPKRSRWLPTASWRRRSWWRSAALMITVSWSEPATSSQLSNLEADVAGALVAARLDAAGEVLAPLSHVGHRFACRHVGAGDHRSCSCRLDSIGRASRTRVALAANSGGAR
jgi:hypothetical protein